MVMVCLVMLMLKKQTPLRALRRLTKLPVWFYQASQHQNASVCIPDAGSKVVYKTNPACGASRVLIQAACPAGAISWCCPAHRPAAYSGW
jgi:hypothetical protein